MLTIIGPLAFGQYYILLSMYSTHVQEFYVLCSLLDKKKWLHYTAFEIIQISFHLCDLVLCMHTPCFKLNSPHFQSYFQQQHVGQIALFNVLGLNCTVEIWHSFSTMGSTSLKE